MPCPAVAAETCVPVYSTPEIYTQLLSENRSRINACRCGWISLPAQQFAGLPGWGLPTLQPPPPHPRRLRRLPPCCRRRDAADPNDGNRRMTWRWQPGMLQANVTRDTWRKSRCATAPAIGHSLRADAIPAGTSSSLAAHPMGAAYLG